MTVRDKIQWILNMMRQGTFEREEVLSLSLLSALTGESIFLLGLPGVGKSMIARRLKLAFKDATVFEYLMSRFSTPDEIFGPVSISKLKDADSYERVIDGYLPDAEIVFLDEIWKAGPAIQNTLLTVLNEKIFRNGKAELPIPLKGVIAASNELPAKDEGLEALWDRFLIRYVVNPIVQKNNFSLLLSPIESDPTPVETEQISHQEYLNYLQESRKVTIPESILEIIYRLREKLNDKINAKDIVSGETDSENLKYYVSDRRWKKSVNILRMSAYLNGRLQIDLSDLMLLSHMLWNDEASIQEIKQLLAEVILASLFRSYLERFKSYKRHAAVAKDKGKDSRKDLYTPDRKHYVIQIDDSPLKITISDYKKLQSSPKDIFFASETKDGTLALRDRGQFAIYFVEEGVVCINNYRYKLRTIADSQLSDDFMAEAGDSIEDIANNLYAKMNQNLFVAKSDMYTTLRQLVAVYRQKMEAI